MTACRWMAGAIVGSLLATTGAARAQDDPTRLTDDQRSRIREWLDAREALRGGAERPSDVRRRELPDWVDADDRLVREWRAAREESRESRSVTTPRRAPRSRTRDPTDDLPDPPPAWRTPPPAPPSSVWVPPPRVPDDTAARRAVLAAVLKTLRDAWPMLVEHYDQAGDGVLSEGEINALRAALDVHLRRFARSAP